MNGNMLWRSAVAGTALLAAALTARLAAQEGVDAPETEAASAARPCLNHPSIRRTKVLNDRNIVFITRDDTIYNNQLPKQCPSLRRGALVSYVIENRRLCTGGNFQVLWEVGPGNYVPAFVCQLGQFVPITEAELEDLTAMTEENRERRLRRRSAREAVTTEQVELPRADTAPPAAEGAAGE